MGRRDVSLDVYVVTASGLWPGRGHRQVAMAAIEGGASAVQLRAPELASDHAAAVKLAAELAARCCQAGVWFVVNNLVEVALQSGADGVHLGRGDDPAGARARLGSKRILGVSVEDTDQARAAEGLGADYIAATVWATATKPEAKPIGLDGVRDVARATRLPLIGIGGIDAANAAEVLQAGCAGVAVVSAVAAAPDPVIATRGLVDAVRAVRTDRRMG